MRVAGDVQRGAASMRPPAKQAENRARRPRCDAGIPASMRPPAKQAENAAAEQIGVGAQGRLNEAACKTGGKRGGEAAPVRADRLQ